MAFDSRPRPVRRPARRRVPLFTALTLLVMAAGLWFAGPLAGSGAASVPAPRLQVAEAQIAAAESAAAEEQAPVETPDTPVAVEPAVVAPVIRSAVAVPGPVSLSAAGPRAPPHS